MNVAAGQKLFAPFAVALGAVDQIAGVQKECGSRRVSIGLANDPRPHRFDLILGIPEIDKRKWLGFDAGSVELIPFGPIRAVADAECVPRFRFEADKASGVVVRGSQVCVEDLSGRFDLLLLQEEIGSFGRLRK